MKTSTIATERLVLREVRKEDALPIYNCWMQDPDVSRYMWWKASNNFEDTKNFVEFELKQIDNPKWNRWIITLKDSLEIIGTCLVYFNDDEKHWDISYNLGKAFWGKGFAYEAMKAAMDFATSEMGIAECITSYAKANSSSEKLLNKLGFKYLKDIPYECNGGEFVTEGVMCKFSLK